MGDWAFAFALTVGCELPIVALCAPRALRRRAAGDSALVNLSTHPLAWFAIRSAGWSWTGVEVAVAVAEAGLYRGVTRMGWGRAVLASVSANGLTAALSFVI